MCPVVSLFVLIVHAFRFCAPFFWLSTGGGSKIRLPKKTGAINLNLSTLIFSGGMKWTRPVSWYGLGELIESNLEWSSQIKTYWGNHILSKIRKNIYLICTANNWSKYLESNRHDLFSMISSQRQPSRGQLNFFSSTINRKSKWIVWALPKIKRCFIWCSSSGGVLRTQPNICNGVFLREYLMANSG